MCEWACFEGRNIRVDHLPIGMLDAGTLSDIVQWLSINAVQRFFVHLLPQSWLRPGLRQMFVGSTTTKVRYIIYNIKSVRMFVFKFIPLGSIQRSIILHNRKIILILQIFAYAIQDALFEFGLSLFKPMQLFDGVLVLGLASHWIIQIALS